jgi:hypothetical protein
MVQENTDVHACSLNLSNIAHAILALQHLKSQSGTHAIPTRQATTTNITARLAFTCSIRFNLKDNSNYEKTVDKQSREKITPEKISIITLRSAREGFECNPQWRRIATFAISTQLLSLF